MAEKKIGEIREELKAVDDEKLPSFIEASSMPASAMIPTLLP